MTTQHPNLNLRILQPTLRVQKNTVSQTHPHYIRGYLMRKLAPNMKIFSSEEYSQWKHTARVPQVNVNQTYNVMYNSDREYQPSCVCPHQAQDESQPVEGRNNSGGGAASSTKEGSLCVQTVLNARCLASVTGRFTEPFPTLHDTDGMECSANSMS